MNTLLLLSLRKQKQAKTCLYFSHHKFHRLTCIYNPVLRLPQLWGVGGGMFTLLSVLHPPLFPHSWDFLPHFHLSNFSSHLIIPNHLQKCQTTHTLRILKLSLDFISSSSVKPSYRKVTSISFYNYVV